MTGKKTECRKAARHNKVIQGNIKYGTHKNRYGINMEYAVDLFLYKILKIITNIIFFL